MPVREGGSYAADPKTGAETLVERTKHPDLVKVEKAAPAPDVPTAPAAPEAASVPPPSGRRAASSKPQE